MNGILIGIGLVWILLLGGIGFTVHLMRKGTKVLVTGYDDSSGTTETRLLKPDKDGLVTWKNGREVQAKFPIDWKYSRPDGRRKIPHFTADVTPGQGRIFKRNPAKNGSEDKLVKVPGMNGQLLMKPRQQDWVAMPGDRMAVVVGAHHVREINRSNSLDLAKLMIIGGVILGVLLILVVVALVLIVKVARSTGAV